MVQTGRPQETAEWVAVKALVDAKGLRTSWIAEQLGIGSPRLWHILHRTYGYPRPVGFEESLARVLGVSVHTIFPPEAAPASATDTESTFGKEIS